MKKVFLTLAFMLFPVLALAHSLPGDHLSFRSGFLHPWTGLDHALSMICVGILAQQWSQGWQWKLPLLFISGLILGGALAKYGISLSWTHAGIALSVIVLGALIALPKQISSILLCIVVVAFAVCHGHSHGVIAQHSHHWAAYASGFITASLCLHIMGVGIALFFMQYLNQTWMRVGGLSVALSGVWMVT